VWASAFELEDRVLPELAMVAARRDRFAVEADKGGAISRHLIALCGRAPLTHIRA